jgi:hypothetical protein
MKRSLFQRIHVFCSSLGVNRSIFAKCVAFVVAVVAIYIFLDSFRIGMCERLSKSIPPLTNDLKIATMSPLSSPPHISVDSALGDILCNDSCLPHYSRFNKVELVDIWKYETLAKEKHVIYRDDDVTLDRSKFSLQGNVLFCEDSATWLKRLWYHLSMLDSEGQVCNYLMVANSENALIWKDILNVITSDTRAYKWLSEKEATLAKTGPGRLYNFLNSLSESDFQKYDLRLLPESYLRAHSHHQLRGRWVTRKGQTKNSFMLCYIFFACILFMWLHKHHHRPIGSLFPSLGRSF